MINRAADESVQKVKTKIFQWKGVGALYDWVYVGLNVFGDRAVNELVTAKLNANTLGRV